MDLFNIQKNLETLHDQVDTITKQYHEAKTLYENLDKHSKTIQAVISMDYEGSESKILRMALNDDQWKDYETSLKAARKEYNRAWALLEGIKIKLSCLQSLGKHLTS